MVKKERRTWDHWALPEGLALGRRGRAGAAVSVVAKVQETWLEKLSMAATGDRFVSKFPKVDSLAPCRMRSMSRLAPWTTEMIWGEGKDGQGHNNHKKNIKELIFLRYFRESVIPVSTPMTLEGLFWWKQTHFVVRTQSASSSHKRNCFATFVVAQKTYFTRIIL